MCSGGVYHDDKEVFSFAIFFYTTSRILNSQIFFISFADDKTVPFSLTTNTRTNTEHLINFSLFM